MFFKTLTQVFPVEIVNEICDYDDTYKLRMNNVINQIKKLNKDIEEFWNTEETPIIQNPRDNWWLYQYHDGCYMYPTRMSSFFKKL
jgi:hypothetical protein|tara:strand:+ start:19938 stop:20195 length:258 start_codon:yes stop_codon:yes gene_type:complete